MPAAARVTDAIATGHACTPVSAIASTLQTKCNIQGQLAAVIGAPIQVHTILVGPNCVPHASTVAGGSSKVTIQGIPASRIGDSADAGAIISGSAKVFIGG